MSTITTIAASGAATTREMTAGEVEELAALQPTAAELLAAERARMVLTRLQFARQSALAGMMTAAEARAWAGAGTDTAMGTAALALVPEGTARDQASIVFAAATTIDRNNALMPALQAVAGLTDEQTDDFFRAAALL
jgi:hypothetical protein